MYIYIYNTHINAYIYMLSIYMYINREHLMSDLFAPSVQVAQPARYQCAGPSCCWFPVCRPAMLLIPPCAGHPCHEFPVCSQSMLLVSRV